MAHIILPERWRRQPQGPVDIDWSNPLTKNLAAFVLFRGRPEDVVALHRSPVAVGNPVYPATHRGLAVALNSSGTGQYISNNAWASLVGRYNGTFACSATPGKTYRGAHVMSMRSGTSTRFYLRHNSTNTASCGWGSSADLPVSKPSWLPGDTAVTALDWGGSGGGWFFRGSQLASLPASLAAPNSAAIGALSNDPTDSIYQFSGVYDWAGIWSASIGEAAHRELAINAWQILRPRKQVTFFLGSFGIPTLSFPGVTDITPGSARPKVTLTF